MTPEFLKLFDGWRHHRQHKTGLWRIISIAQKSITPISGSAVVVQRPYFSNAYIFKMVLRQCLACNAMVSFKNDLMISLKIAILLHVEEFISRRQYSNLSLSVDKIFPSHNDKKGNLISFVQVDNNLLPLDLCLNYRFAKIYRLIESAVKSQVFHGSFIRLPSTRWRPKAGQGRLSKLSYTTF